MAKHLKVKAELVLPHFTMCKITILEQTHTGSEFGDVDNSATLSNFKAKNGVTLIVNGYVVVGSKAFGVLSASTIKLAVNASSRSCTTAVDRWPAIRDAIAEYNAYFTDEAIAERARVKLRKAKEELEKYAGYGTEYVDRYTWKQVAELHTAQQHYWRSSLAGYLYDIPKLKGGNTT